MRKIRATFMGKSIQVVDGLVNKYTYNLTIIYIEDSKITIKVKHHEITYDNILEFLDNWANISKIGDIEQGIQADTGDSSATNN